jgi:hypothetical protein
MKLDDNFIESIDLQKIHEYLVHKQWKSAGTQWGGLTELFNCPFKQYAQIELPTKRDKQYNYFISRAIRYLAELEKRTEDALLFDIMYFDQDIVSYRSVSPHTNLGSIPFEKGVDFITAVKNVLLNSLADTTKASGSYMKKARRELLDKAQLTPPEKGSFIVKVICPLDAVSAPTTSTPLFNHLHETTMRSTTKHLIKTTNEIAESVDSHTIGKFIDKIKKEKTSTRIYNSIVKTQIFKNGSTDIAIQWSKKLDMTDKSIPNKVELTPKHFDGIAEILEAVNPPRKQKDNIEDFIAVVDELRGKYNNETREGKVTLKIFSKQGKTIKATANLNRQQYETAINNHKQKKGNYIQVTGRLLSKAHDNEITDITEIKTVPSKNTNEFETQTQPTQTLLYNTSTE